MKEEKKLPKGLSSVAVIKESSADPLFKAKLASFASIAKATEGFLTKFQSPAPMAPFLYDDIYDLMRNLMQRVVKSNVLESADTPRKLIAVDLKDDKNLLSRDKMGIGIGAVSEMAKAKCSDVQKMEFQMQFRKFIIGLLEKTIERSPLKYKATRAITCINPSLILYNRTTSETRMTDLLQILHDLGRITSTEADDVKAKFSELCASAKSKHKEQFDSFNREQNLDTFYSKIFAGDEKQVPLWKVIKMVLILSHGNAAVESGFSVNKELIVENMEEETIVAQRIVFDAIRVAGMDVTKVDISKKMIGCVRQSHSAYQSAQQLKKEKQSAEQKRASEDRKRKAEIASLQQQKKKQKLAELKAEAAAIDSKIASIESGKGRH